MCTINRGIFPTNFISGIFLLPVLCGLLAGQSVTDLDFTGHSTLKAWIYLRNSIGFIHLFKSLEFPEKTLRRLNKIGSVSSITSADRIPTEELQATIAGNVVKLRYYSRSLNAYSAEIDAENFRQLSALPIVDRIEAVGCDVSAAPQDWLCVERGEAAALDKSLTTDCDRQLSQLNVPAVHARGLSGAGVRIGIIDTGFSRDHEVFTEIVATGRLIAEYDFINDDENVADETSADTSFYGRQSVHGTAVWSAIGGYNPPVYVGVAPGAEFLLAKTERLSAEIRREEDDFVAAVEWCDYWGADIISVSIGYRDFSKESNYFVYPYSQIDGQTAVTSRAVNWAFGRGILCVCCAGNEAGHFDDGGLITPADAFGALAVGAVDYQGNLASFNSTGPTYDGRIKPDLCAMGVATYLALSNARDTYFTSNGTSYATPLIAGCAALLLESQPYLGPGEIITELKRYAGKEGAVLPNNQFGWGIPDIYESIVNYEPDGFPKTEISPEKILAYPNPTNSSVNFYFVWQKATPVTSVTSLRVFNIRGQLIYEKKLTGNYLGKKEIVSWNLRNQFGELATAGIYIVRLQGPDYYKTGKFIIMH